MKTSYAVPFPLTVICINAVPLRGGVGVCKEPRIGLDAGFFVSAVCAVFDVRCTLVKHCASRH